MTQVKYNDEWIAEAIVNVSQDYDRGKSKTVIYFSGVPEPEDLDPETWNKEMKQTLHDESNVKGSKVWRAFNKAERVLHKHAFEAVKQDIIDTLKAETGYTTNLKTDDGKDYKLVFDRYAGCGCGCSPGWRLKTHNYKTVNFDAWRNTTIDITLATPVQKAEQERNKIIADKSRADYAVKNQIEKVEKLTAELDKAHKELNVAQDRLFNAQRAVKELETTTTNKKESK
jgi:hypothetical protein